VELGEKLVFGSLGGPSWKRLFLRGVVFGPVYLPVLLVTMLEGKRDCMQAGGCGATS